MPGLAIFKAPDLDTTTRQFADHLPEGRAWNNKINEDSIMYKNIKSLASAFNIVQQQIEEIATEFNINLTVDLLPDWEESVGIPDDCIFELESLEERRETVIQRLKKVPVVTKAEFEALALSLGTEVTVTPGGSVEGFPLTFPFNFSSTFPKFRMFVYFPNGNGDRLGFPYNFPLTFGSFNIDIIKCVFDKVAPASIEIIYI